MKEDRLGLDEDFLCPFVHGGRVCGYFFPQILSTKCLFKSLQTVQPCLLELMTVYTVFYSGVFFLKQSICSVGVWMPRLVSFASGLLLNLLSYRADVIIRALLGWRRLRPDKYAPWKSAAEAGAAAARGHVDRGGFWQALLSRPPTHRRQQANCAFFKSSLRPNRTHMQAFLTSDIDPPSADISAAPSTSNI